MVALRRLSWTPTQKPTFIAVRENVWMDKGVMLAWVERIGLGRENLGTVLCNSSRSPHPNPDFVCYRCHMVVLFVCKIQELGVEMKTSLVDVVPSASSSPMGLISPLRTTPGNSGRIGWSPKASTMAQLVLQQGWTWQGGSVRQWQRIT